jgi:hypothetical protein
MSNHFTREKRSSRWRRSQTAGAKGCANRPGTWPSREQPGQASIGLSDVAEILAQRFPREPLRIALLPSVE